MQRFIRLEKSLLSHILAYFTVTADFIEKSVDSIIIFIIKRLEFRHSFRSSLILLFFRKSYYVYTAYRKKVTGMFKFS